MPVKRRTFQATFDKMQELKDKGYSADLVWRAIRNALLESGISREAKALSIPIYFGYLEEIYGAREVAPLRDSMKLEVKLP